MKHVKQVSLGGDHSAAITENGDLYLWGNNGYGQLGDGSTERSLEPKKVMEHMKQVSLGKYHSAAISENGDLYLWGNNEYGQLGDGSTENNFFVPKKVMEHVKQVSLGGQHSAAITENGDLYLWGYDGEGQLGYGSDENSFVPKKVMEDVKQVSLGKEHSAALTENGDLYLWGYNAYGQLGDGSNTDSITPTKVMENVKEVSLGDYHSAAVTEEGELYLWGGNSYGELAECPQNVTYCDTPKKITITPSSSVDNTYTPQNSSEPVLLAAAERQAAYADLQPEKDYIFYVLKSGTEENSPASENLLYIAQGTADKDGKLYFSYRISGYSGNVTEKISSAGRFSTGEVTGIPGDVNNDGVFNMADAALVRRYVANLNVTIDTSAADVNRDGRIDMVDYALMRRALANWDVELT